MKRQRKHCHLYYFCDKESAIFEKRTHEKSESVFFRASKSDSDVIFSEKSVKMTLPEGEKIALKAQKAPIEKNGRSFVFTLKKREERTQSEKIEARAKMFFSRIESTQNKTAHKKSKTLFFENTTFLPSSPLSSALIFSETAAVIAPEKSEKTSIGERRAKTPRPR